MGPFLCPFRHFVSQIASYQYILPASTARAALVKSPLLRAPPKSIQSQKGAYICTIFYLLYCIVTNFTGNSCARQVNGLDQNFRVQYRATAVHRVLTHSVTECYVVYPLMTTATYHYINRFRVRKGYIYTCTIFYLLYCIVTNFTGNLCAR